MTTRTDQRATATDRIELSVSGMTCASCVNRVQKALLKVPGVKEASVNLATETAEVVFDEPIPDGAPTSDLIAAVDRAGYSAEPLVSPEPSRTSSYVLEVSGMTCASCVNRVQKALLKVPGVKEASVNLATETAEVEVPDLIDRQSLIDAVIEAGYGAEIAGASKTLEEASIERQARRSADLRARVVKLWVGAVLSIAVLILGYGFSSTWALDLQLVLTAPIYFWVGANFHTGAIRALRHGAANMDTLVSLGSTVAFVYSVSVTVFMPSRVAYFDVAALILTLISLGKYLELSAKVRAGAALELLMTLRPTSAHLLAKANAVASGDASRTVDVPVDSLRVGDSVLVRPGEAIPTDGVLFEGSASVDEALVTGESLPVTKVSGSDVVGGSINGFSPFVMKVTKTGSETVLAQIVEAVQRAQTEKSKVQRLADSVSAVFVPVILVVALATFIGWLLSGHSFVESLIPAVAVLVVACPCAMGLATPMATLVGTTKGATIGLLLSGGDSLEVARFVKTIVMDKTGTLTEGHAKVVGTVALSDMDVDEALSIASALEAGSEHPLARAISAAHSGSDGLVPLAGMNVEPGMGVWARSEDGERLYRLGSIEYISRNSGVAVSSLDAAVAPLGPNVAVVILAIDEHPVLAVGVSDPIRNDARAGIAALQSQGIKVVLASGDRQQVVETIASTLGIDEAYSGLTPTQKADLVVKLKQRDGSVAMVGDGINDAPALAIADVGIAVGSGTAVAMASADMTLVHGDVAAISDAISLSKATRRVIWQNLGWAFGYNLVLVPLAAFGILPPIFAALAMATSSVSVVLNSMRLRRFTPLADRSGLRDRSVPVAVS